MDFGIMNTEQRMGRPKLGRTDGWLVNRSVGMAHELPMNCNQKSCEPAIVSRETIGSSRFSRKAWSR